LLLGLLLLPDLLRQVLHWLHSIPPVLAIGFTSGWGCCCCSSKLVELLLLLRL
jgi:hypothetical protein